jgi:NAD(P)-dependent dehydrogenase (short-subunit alcohol dehydrogenase family)
VVAGGTDGMGRGIATGRAEIGDEVIAIGSTTRKGLPANVGFLRADLSVVAEVDRVVAELSGPVDVLVLTADRFHPKRTVTADGLEATFALYYLSRYLLAHGLDAGLVVAFSAPGVTAGRVHWDDPQLTSGYSGVKAQLQAGRMNDLLGVAVAEEKPYVLFHPGFTRTNAISQIPQPMRTVIRALEKVAARTVAEAIRPVLDVIDEPPSAGFHPIDRGKPVDPALKTFDRADAARLADLTREVVRRTR